MIRRSFCLLIALVMLLSIPVAQAANVDGAKQSVARVFVDYCDENGNYIDSVTGSCFAIGKPNEPVKYFATNRHVVEKAAIFKVNEQEVVGYAFRYLIILDNISNALVANLEYIAGENEADIAVLSLTSPTKERKASILRPFSQLNNEEVYTIGFPGVSDQMKNLVAHEQYNSSIGDMSVNRGIVSRIIPSAQSAMASELIQSDAAINHGNSGGPMVDANGRVVGINTYGLTFDNQMNITPGNFFAVSSNQLIKVLDNEHIPYATSNGLNIWLIAAIVLGAAVIGVGVMLVLQSRKGAASSRKAAAKGNNRSLVGTDGKRHTVGHKLVIGRDPKRCKLVLPSDTSGVSSVHCIVSFDGARVTVTDQKSSYGTFIGETRLAPGKPTVMHRGQTLYLGSKKNGYTLHS